MEKNTLNNLIGKRLRNLREKRHLSLEQAAHLTDVSKPMLGQIERGQSNPTVSTLWKIADGLGVPFTAFVEEEQPEIKKISRHQLSPINENHGKFKVYPVFPMVPGQFFEIFSVTLKPGCHYVSNPHHRGVKENVWVTTGEVTIRLQHNEYTVKEQEGISFVADIEHEYINNTNQSSEVLMVIHYPDTH